MNQATQSINDTPRSSRTMYACLFLIAIGSLIFRYFASEPIEMGGDAVLKWTIVKQYILYGDLPSQWNHHACRWAINIPVLCIQKIFGHAPTNYYIWPFITATLTAVFSYLLVERLRSWRVGLLAGTLVILSQPMLRLGSQLLPMGTVTAFLLGSLYCIMLWQPSNQRRYVLLSAILFFIAYGAKLTTLYYLPAFLLILLIYSKSKREWIFSTSLFLCTFFVGIAIEQSLFNALSGASWGRWELVLSSHHAIRQSVPLAMPWKNISYSLFQYLANIFVYMKYPGNEIAFLYYFALLIATIALIKKWRDMYLISIIFLFGFLGTAYATTSVFPFLRPERMLFRYQTAIFEFALLLIVLFLTHPNFLAYLSKRQLPRHMRPQVLQAILILILMLPIAGYASKKIQINNGIVQTADATKVTQQAAADGLPIFIPEADNNPRRDRKNLFKFREVYTRHRDFGRYNPYTQDINLDAIPKVFRMGKTYFLADRNGFEGNLKENAVLLREF